ncbi:uncharacterized protein TNCV_151311 [Trichonephila clavipes]|uniref:Mutator-like transposase domain-containing protein n=1 Tax=Trichonephila clavipes TaxID=2585209 RepID=A0A8X6RFU7_TRICX|nr:uncharacterized protein TNCV_151311 [Trichonephila clavipes]
MEIVMLPYILPLLLGRTFNLDTMQIGVDIFPKNVTDNPIIIQNPVTETKYKVVDNTIDSRNLLDVSGSFSLNIKGGLFKAGASGAYLTDKYNRENTVEVAVRAVYQTVTEQLPSDAKPNELWKTLGEAVGTHFVRSITYGGELIVALRLECNSTRDKQRIKAAVDVGGRIEIFDVGLEVEGEYMKDVSKTVESTQIKVFSSIPLSKAPNDMDILKETMKNFPEDLKNFNKGRGIPIKIELWPLSLLDPSKTDKLRNRVFDKTILFTNIQNFASCKKCGGDIKLSEKCVRGLSSVFSIECKNCKDLCSFRNSKMLGKRKNIPEINRRFVYAMRTIGQGHTAMTTFCGVMDFHPPVAEKSYNNIVNKLQLCSKEVAEASMQSAALEKVTLTNSSDIIISGDGTWKTCGYSSCVGVCAVIGDKTGKCIDAEVMSSFCKGCDSWKRRKGSPAYKKWKILHVKECLKNHNDSAGMMETVGIVRIFQRSLSHRSVRYTSYIGDGDSKTFSSITASNPYGEDNTVSKIECVGHVQKRMGTRLRKLKQMSSKLSDGKSIGGKGRLTDRIIDLITTYYGNAIRQNKTCLSDMRKAVWAVYFHIRSSDEEPLHSFCPVGPNSWCKYQNQVVEGSVETFRHSNKLPVAVMDA